MKHERITIWESGSFDGKAADGFNPVLDTYLLESPEPRPVVLVCPGGGYRFTSDREAEPIAIRFNSAGFHAFVLYYSVAPRRHPHPLMDLSRSLSLIRDHADDWQLKPDQVAVCGFSAGGHLAASLGVHWQRDWFQGVNGITPGQNRPNALILGYPVIMPGPLGHAGSFVNLLGENCSPEDRALMTLQDHVGEHTPPAFLWHTVSDAAVPVANSLEFAGALCRHHISFEMHLYPAGPHGLSLAEPETARKGTALVNPHVAGWTALCAEWLRIVFR